jgi:hypothetical protein
VRLRGTLFWEANGESQLDEVLVADEQPNGAHARVVILDRSGNRRAASPAELPPGSVLLLPQDASDNEVDRIQHSGYAARRATPSTANDLNMADVLAESAADAASRRAAIDAADAELDEVIERLQRQLQARHPELFDSAGRLIPEEYARQMLKITGGRKLLTREEILALGGVQIPPPGGARPADAP